MLPIFESPWSGERNVPFQARKISLVCMQIALRSGKILLLRETYNKPKLLLKLYCCHPTSGYEEV